MSAALPALRHADYSLSDEQLAVRETFSTLLRKECPPERVRDAEPVGFDEELWGRLVDVGATTLGVPAAAGGDGGGLVELALVAEEIGRWLAPVPFVEASVAARLLARCGPSGSEFLSALLAGEHLVAVALGRSQPGVSQLVPAGAIAGGAIGLVHDKLVLAIPDGQPPHVINHGSAPFARWDLSGDGVERRVLVDGARALEVFGQAQREWRLLTAASLIGAAEGALELAADFARGRRAFGRPIAAFQAVAHPLADCAIAIVGGRRLVWRAAWFADHEPEGERHLVHMAFLHAARTATRTTTVGVHTQGGVGFTTESAMQLFFRRAKGWANVGGDPTGERGLIAETLYGPAA